MKGRFRTFRAESDQNELPSLQAKPSMSPPIRVHPVSLRSRRDGLLRFARNDGRGRVNLIGNGSRIAGELVESLDKSEISRQDYLGGINEQLRLSAARSRRVLGDGDFAMIYGEPGRSPDSLIDPEIFLFDGQAA